MEDENTEVETPENPASPTTKKKKSKKKLAITLSVVVLVIGIAGAGLWTWHLQPSFCSTVCHSSMEPFYQSWDAGDGLAAEHKAANVDCLSCHKPTIDQQVSEVVKQVTNDYDKPIKFKPLGTTEFCGDNDCHSYTELAEATADYSGGKYNPHDFHGGKIDCYNCHRVHEQSQMYCTSCHDGIEVPEGWKAL